MVKVVAGYDDRGVMFLVVALEQVLDDALAAGVEEVEGLIEDEQLGVVEHGGDDAYLLLVAHGEVADVLLLTQHLAVHEALKRLKPSIHLLFFESVHLADEVEVLLGSEVVDEEAVVDEGVGEGFPLLALLHGDALEGDVAAVGLQQVENQPEEGGLAGSVVAHQAEHLALGYLVLLDIDSELAAESLL